MGTPPGADNNGGVINIIDKVFIYILFCDDVLQT